MILPLLLAAPARGGGSDPAEASAALLAAGRFREAAEEAARCPAPRCALVEGRALLSSGEPARAVRALARARGALGPLEPWGALLSGQALLLAGSPAEAVAPLRQAAQGPGDSPAVARAAALLGDALLEADDPLAAAEAAERAFSLPAQPRDVRAGVFWTLAQAQARLALRSREAGALARARGALLRFWRDFPDHPAQEQAAGLRAELDAAAGQPAPRPSPQDLLARAQRLLGAGEPARAAQEASRARAGLSAGEERSEASLLLARCLAADGRRGEASPFLQEAFRAAQPRVGAPAGLLLARDRARRALLEPALKVLDELARRFPDTNEADEGGLVAARLLLDAGKEPQARARLSRLAARGRGGPAADARWTLAWLSWRKGRPDAAGRFGAYAAAAEDDEGRARGLYWQARAGEPAEAKARLQRALALDPLGYTGVLARAALGEPRAETPPFPPPAPPAADAQQAADGPLALARDLLRVGFLPEAAAETERWAQAHRGQVAALLPALALWEAAGRYDRSVHLAQQLLIGRPAPWDLARGAPADTTIAALLRAAHPAAFPEAVAASARRLHIDPYLLLAVVRRESVFRPDARSAAGAVGLVQLLPATARRAALVLGRPEPADLDLASPPLALDLGAWYLAEMLGRFGDPAVALAAYNAGPRAVAPWALQGAGTPLDVWLEEIPYRETRHYVKAVVGAWSAYRILAGGGAARLGPVVPGPRAGTEF